MSFFQNPFAAEFRGNLVLGDRQYSLTFVCPRNTGRSDEMVASFGTAPFTFSGNDADGTAKTNLSIRFANDQNDFKNWQTLTVDVTNGLGGTTGITTAQVVAVLNATAVFNSFFLASVDNNGRVMIQQKMPVTRMRFFIQNTGAETVLKFNARAGVAELPTYMARHTVANALVFTDSSNMLVALNTALGVDQAVITNATDFRGTSLGLDYTTVQADWQLFGGRSGLFQFTKGTGVVADTNTQIIYSAGAKVGDLALKVVTELDASGNVVNKYELPYTLTSGDLITPP